MANRRWEIFRFTLAEVYPIHWHEFYEVHWVVEGRGTHVLNGERYRMGPGSLFMMTPADFHELAPDPGEPITMYNLIFDEEFVPADLRELVLADLRHLSVVLTGEAFAMVDREFETVRQEAAAGSGGFEHMVLSGLVRILVTLYRASPPAKVAGARAAALYPAPVQQALAYIQRHFRDPLTLAQVACRVGLSPNYFSELFHQVTGDPFQTYLQKLRLRFAKSLISTSDLPITEICYASGFNTLTHFERVFRQHYGLTPRACRTADPLATRVPDGR